MAIVKNLYDRIRKSGPLTRVTLALVVYSCAVLGWTILAGVHLDAELEGAPAFAGYLGKFNWSLFPVWWVLLAILVHLSWEPFIAAWRDVHAKGMLLDRSGKPAGEQEVAAFCRRLGRWRIGLVALAVAVSCAITYFDTADLRKIYRACGPGGADFEVLLGTRSAGVSQSCSDVAVAARRDLRRACGAGGFSIAHGWPLKTGPGASPACTAAAAEISGELEVDFNIAYLVYDRAREPNRIDPISREHNRWLNRAVYLQQVGLGAMAVLGLLQLGLLCYLFWRLENAAWINRQGLKLVLDPYSKLYEFGLESWNHALNNIYWVFSLALLVPLASRQSQSGESLDFGQMVLQIGVPAIIAMPMLATIIARQQRQRNLWPLILAEEDPARIDLYHRQRLWPLDRNWASKLGIVLSFVMLSYLLGKNLLSLTG